MLLHTSRVKTLNAEESLAKEAFTKECFRDPTVRDRMSMLTRAFTSRKKVNLIVLIITVLSDLLTAIC